MVGAEPTFSGDATSLRSSTRQFVQIARKNLAFEQTNIAFEMV
jgi:hypothetical protein